MEKMFLLSLISCHRSKSWVIVWDPKRMCISSMPIIGALRLGMCQLKAEAKFCFESVSALEKKCIIFPVSVPDMHK